MDEDVAPPISEESKVASFILNKKRKDHYKVAILLPMRIETSIAVEELSPNNQKFANFYAGMKMAGSEESEVHVSVKIYYTNRDVYKMQEIFDDWDIFQPDLIIGSYESDIITRTADWARNNRVPLISPWLSSTKITEENIFYLQLRPSITSYYEKMIEHINDHFDAEKVYVIGRDAVNDHMMKRILNRLNERMSGVPNVTAFNEIVVPMDSLMHGDSLFADVFEEGAKAFVIPHYSSRDESYVYSCLRKLYAEQGMHDFYIYTMPLILNSDRVDINILKNLKTRTCEFRFPDKRNPNVQKFRKQYFEKYGWLPSDDAYYGYDVMKFVLYGLSEYGQYFHYYMKDETLDLLQMKIHVVPYFKREGSERPDFMANNHLYIIEYDIDHFVIKDIR